VNRQRKVSGKAPEVGVTMSYRSATRPVVVCSSSFKRYDLEEAKNSDSLTTSEMDFFVSLKEYLPGKLRRLSGRFSSKSS